MKSILKKFHTRWGMLAVCAFSMLFRNAPAALSAERMIIDDLGFKVAVKSNVLRVISLVPTNSEMVCLLDCARLKGGTRYDWLPEEKTRVQLKRVEIIGGGFDANLEKIVQLQPDLILTNGPSQERFAVPLKNLGYSVLSLWPRDMNGLKRDFLLLGELLGQESKATSVIEAMERRLRIIEAKAKNRANKKVYLQMWTEPLITVGRLSFTDWLVTAAGGINVFGDLPFDSAQVSLESLIQRNPEVLIFLADQERFVKTLGRRPGWSSIRGVRDSRFCFIDERDIRRSIEVLSGLAKMQDCLFGEKSGTETTSTGTK